MTLPPPPPPTTPSPLASWPPRPDMAAELRRIGDELHDVVELLRRLVDVAAPLHGTPPAEPLKGTGRDPLPPLPDPGVTVRS